ncbi:helitron_like_N domain-containing protein [Trichonephila clavata]|uniref:Helitron_like_N domain-containing protein n=1 Tax=Trichonephila clavata TaxID=2740835 RepID=A0A8X6HG07_TRICU|nr:helitron_like_N domain-containing protein [Trichonephila clavata]
MNQKKKNRKSCKLVIESDFECFCSDDEDVSKSDGHTCVYDLNIKDVNKATSNDYYAYHMMQRVNEFNTLLRCPRLFQHYIVDMYAKVENERLRFIRLNQTKLRAEDHGVLLEAVRNDNTVNSENLGKLVVLP